MAPNLQLLFYNILTLPERIEHMKKTGNWDTLTESTRKIVKEAILEAAENRKGPKGYKLDTDCLDDIEYQSRDGFIAYDSNRGGLTYQNFSDLDAYWGGGYSVAHKQAAKEIERQIDYSFELLREDVFKTHETILVTAGITQEQCDYHTLNEASDKDETLYPAFRYLEDQENDYLGGESSSIMHEFRFLYHGKDPKGLHSASISAAINIEGPYHRSSIPWAPGVFCEGVKEVEIKWRNNAELKRKLDKALNKVSKAIF